MVVAFAESHRERDRVTDKLFEKIYNLLMMLKPYVSKFLESQLKHLIEYLLHSLRQLRKGQITTLQEHNIRWEIEDVKLVIEECLAACQAFQRCSAVGACETSRTWLGPYNHYVVRLVMVKEWTDKLQEYMNKLTDHEAQLYQELAVFQTLKIQAIHHRVDVARLLEYDNLSIMEKELMDIVDQAGGAENCWDDSETTEKLFSVYKRHGANGLTGKKDAKQDLISDIKADNNVLSFLSDNLVSYKVRLFHTSILFICSNTCFAFDQSY